MIAGRSLVLPLVLVALALPVRPSAHGGENHEEPEVEEGRFEAPEPGSYELPPITRVRPFELLLPDGSRSRLPGLEPGQLAVVSFVYRSCTQASGCPLALATLGRLDREIDERPQLRGRVRLVTVSFDPERDTPEKMAELEQAMSPRGDWRFLTTRSAEELRPLLVSYGQDVVRLPGPDGVESDVLRHVLKVFLIDERGDVRNIYSTGFLDPRLVVADLLTLQLANP